MATYGEMQTSIKNQIARNDLDDEIKTAIQRAVKYYEREGFYFNEEKTSASLTTANGTQSYNLPDDFVEDMVLTLQLGGRKYDLSKRTYAEMEAIDVNDTYGQPSFYTIFKGQIQYYPIPNQSFTVQLSYIKRLTTLSASTDSNSWTTDCEDLIESRALSWLYRRYIHDPAMAGEMKAAEVEALDALKSETTKRFSAMIFPTAF